jgi:hypothetical protein
MEKARMHIYLRNIRDVADEALKMDSDEELREAILEMRNDLIMAKSLLPAIDSCRPDLGPA